MQEHFDGVAFAFDKLDEIDPLLFLTVNKHNDESLQNAFKFMLELLGTYIYIYIYIYIFINYKNLKKIKK